MKTIRRNISTINADKIKETPQGGIKMEGVVICAGVFEYDNLQADGTIITSQELITSDALKNSIALSSLEAAPFTDDHPEQMVNPETFASVTKGSVINPRYEENKLVADIIVNDKETIDVILSGKKKELSAGYMAELVKKTGVYNNPKTNKDEKYDTVQQNIIFNHVSLVDLGRCGPDVALRLNMAKQMVNTKKSKGTVIKGTAKNNVNNETVTRTNVIEEVNGEFCLKSKDGTTELGCFKTKAEAEAREKEILALQHQQTVDNAGNVDSGNVEEPENKQNQNEKVMKVLEEMMGLMSKLKESFSMNEANKDVNKEDESDSATLNSSDAKKFNELVKTETLERMRLLLAAKELGVTVNGKEDKRELQLIIIGQAKPNIKDLDKRSDEVVGAFLEDVLADLNLDDYWKRSEEATLNSVLTTVRADITNVATNNKQDISTSRTVQQVAKYYNIY